MPKGSSTSKNSKKRRSKRRAAPSIPNHLADRRMYVAPSPIAGRGMFAAEDIPAGTTVHVAPVIVMDEHDHLAIDDTELTGYVYEWFEGGVAFALGYGSLFNHAGDPNCKYELADEDHPSWPAMEYSTLEAVAAGEELTIGYVEDPDDLWFDIR